MRWNAVPNDATREMEEATAEVDTRERIVEGAETRRARASCDQHEWIGACAGFFTTTAFLPQVYRTYATEEAGGVSIGMYCMFSIGVGLWVLYGIVKRAHSLVFTNCVTLALTLLILLRLLENT